MNFKQCFTVLLVFYFGYSNACDCPQLNKESMVEKGIKYADIIFYGEVIEADSIKETYTFKIFELYKGLFKSKIINGKTDGNCSILPRKGEIWIVYSELSKDNIIDINICSPSQAMAFDSGYPLPPPLKKVNGKWVNQSETEVRLFELEYKNKSLTNFIYQLEKLRQYKLTQNSMTNEIKGDSKDTIMIISLIINAILLLTIIFLIVSKKNSNNRIPK